MPPAGPWPDGQARYARDGAQPQRAPLIKTPAQPAPLARAAGGKERCASGGSWPDGQARYARDGAQPQRAPLIKTHAQPAPPARAAGGKTMCDGVGVYSGNYCGSAPRTTSNREYLEWLWSEMERGPM